MWRAVHADLPAGWAFDGRDLAALEQACRQADVVAELEKQIETRGLFVRGSQMQSRLNPAVAEVRQGRLAVGQLLGRINMPDVDEAKPESAATVRAKKAARARWAERTARKAEHGG